MCPYISGAAGSGVRVVESDPRNPHVVYVAVNTAALIDPISFSVVSSTVSNNAQLMLALAYLLVIGTV